jgi:hypothetical protein
MHARISQSDVVRWLVLLGLVGCLIVVTQPICAQESAKFEKIRDTSPDGKFAVRISCSSELEDPDKIDPDLITSVELVSLPSKKIVTTLLPGEGAAIYGYTIFLIWSPDSKWCAFYYSSPRVGETDIYRRSGDEFSALETENLRVDVKGDVRNEYVRPLRWVKPGVLSLQQFTTFRGGEGSATYRFVAKFDENTGKFRIISKKRLPSKE